MRSHEEPRRAATIQAAQGVARRQGIAAVVPRSASATYGRERLVDLGWGQRPALDLLVPRAPAPGVVACLPALRAELGLSPRPGRADFSGTTQDLLAQ